MGLESSPVFNYCSIREGFRPVGRTKAIGKSAAILHHNNEPGKNHDLGMRMKDNNLISFLLIYIQSSLDSFNDNVSIIFIIRGYNFHINLFD